MDRRYETEDDRGGRGYDYDRGRGGAYGYERRGNEGGGISRDYERNYGGRGPGRDYDRGYQSDYGRTQGGYYGGGRDFDRDYDRERYGRGYGERAGYGYERGRGDRGWWDRASDEVASWFGDEEAERRRHMDERRGDTHRGRGPRGYRRSDSRIEEDVNDRLSDHPSLDASDIEVKVENQEVTLTGTVKGRRDKRLAEDIAESVSGVTNVENRIRVKREGEGKTTLGVGSADTGTTRAAAAGSSTTTTGARTRSAT